MWGRHQAVPGEVHQENFTNGADQQRRGLSWGDMHVGAQAVSLLQPRAGMQVRGLFFPIQFVLAREQVFSHAHFNPLSDVIDLLEPRQSNICKNQDQM